MLPTTISLSSRPPPWALHPEVIFRSERAPAPPKPAQPQPDPAVDLDAWRLAEEMRLAAFVTLADAQTFAGELPGLEPPQQSNIPRRIRGLLADDLFHPI